MAAVSTIIMATAATVGVASYVEAKDARKDQARAVARQNEVQRQMQSEQKAANVSAAAAERRQQIREARVRRARIMQGAANTGTMGSSSAFGALGGISTNLGSNIGANLGSIQTANNLTDLGQTAADFGTQANLANIKGQNATSMFQLSSSIFSGVGGPEKVMNWIS